MNDFESHELLSAWLDGETTPEEAARVEQLLESSPEARRTLDELSLLSQMLHGLPVEPAPAELAAAVHQQAERETLLPAAAALPAKGRRGRGWWMTVSGLVASAAGLLLMVYVISGGDGSQRLTDISHDHGAAHRDQDGTVIANNGREPTAPVVLRPEAAEPPEVAALDAPRDRNGVQLKDGGTEGWESLGGVGQREMSRGAGSAGRPAPAERQSAPADDANFARTKQLSQSGEGLARQNRAAATPAAPMAATEQAAAPRLDSVRRRESAANLEFKNAKIGDVLPYFDTDGDRVAVVEVTVVDVQQAVGTLQLLLSKNAIPALDGAEPQDEASPARKAQKRDPDAARDAKPRSDDRDGLVALYVETTEAQLASALEQINSGDLFVDLRLQPPVALGRLEIAEAENAPQARFSVSDKQVEKEVREKVAEAVTRSQREARTLREESFGATLADADNHARDSANEARSARGAFRMQTKPSNAAAGASAAPQPGAAPAPPAANPVADRAEEKGGAVGRTLAASPLADHKSFQLLVKVPADARESAKESSIPTDGLRAIEKPAANPAVEAAADKPAEPAPLLAATRKAKDNTQPAPLRVIFVFQPAEPPKAGS